jgi:hypothetical protein
LPERFGQRLPLFGFRRILHRRSHRPEQETVTRFNRSAAQRLELIGRFRLDEKRDRIHLESLFEVGLRVAQCLGGTELAFDQVPAFNRPR